MENVIVKCTVCPNNCEITAEVEDGEVLDVYGNGCMKGMIYAQREALAVIETE